MKNRKPLASKLVRVGRHVVELRIVSRVQAKDLGKTKPRPKRRPKSKAAPKSPTKPRRGKR